MQELRLNVIYHVKSGMVEEFMGKLIEADSHKTNIYLITRFIRNTLKKRPIGRSFNQLMVI